MLAVLTAAGCDFAGSRADEVLGSYVDSGRIPGVVAITASGDQILHQAAFGNESTEPEEAMALDTIFLTSSMTAPVTAVAVMQLVEEGKVELDASMGDYLIEYSQPEVLEGFDEEGAPLLRKASRSPTIRELLTNTSGYAYSIWNPKLRQYPLDVGFPAGRFVFRFLPLVHEPGERWEYGPNAGILAILIEVVSGQSLDEYFYRHIFEPLGMNDSFFQYSEHDLDRLAQSHFRQDDGGFRVFGGSRLRGVDGGADVRERSRSFGLPAHSTSSTGDGGLRSTAPDYIRFVRALLNGGELDGARILAAETVEQMGVNQIGKLDVEGHVISDPRGSSSDVELSLGAEDKFGLGFFVTGESIPEGRSKGAMLWTSLTNTYFWIDREQNLGGVLLTSIQPFGDTTFAEMVSEYEQAIYAEYR